MPNIKPISDLRNYTTVINEVTYGNRVYLTRNGHGQCAIIDMKELDELDKQKALYTLMSKLNEAEVSIREEGTISADFSCQTKRDSFRFCSFRFSREYAVSQ